MSEANTVSGDVVGLFGNVPQGVPVAAIVKLLEDMLERARTGELRAIAICASIGDDIARVEYQYHYQYGHAYTLHMALSIAGAKLLRECTGE